MYEYILFHEKPFQLFIDWLTENGVTFETGKEHVDDNYVIKLSADLDDDLIDEIEDKYDVYVDMSEQIVTQEEKDNNEGYHMAGVVVTLKDGSISYADIDPDVMSRVIDVITPVEFTGIVNAIADAVENPQPKTSANDFVKVKNKQLTVYSIIMANPNWII